MILRTNNTSNIRESNIERSGMSHRAYMLIMMLLCMAAIVCGQPLVTHVFDPDARPLNCNGG